MEGSTSAGSDIDRASAPGVVAGDRPRRRTRSQINHAAEERVLASVRHGRPREALKILMSVYGYPITAFAQRILRQSELANDIRQQVFLDAFQGLERFKGHSSLWTWLCGITYHRCIDELRRNPPAGATEDLDAFEGSVFETDPTIDPEQIAKRRALERCLAKLSVAMRSQLLMRYLLGLSYVEIAETIGEAHSTVQVRVSRILPRLRQCLLGEGVAR